MSCNFEEVGTEGLADSRKAKDYPLYEMDSSQLVGLKLSVVVSSEDLISTSFKSQPR